MRQTRDLLRVQSPRLSTRRRRATQRHDVRLFGYPETRDAGTCRVAMRRARSRSTRTSRWQTPRVADPDVHPYLDTDARTNRLTTAPIFPPPLRPKR